MPPLFAETDDVQLRHAEQLKHYQHLKDEVFNSYARAVEEDNTYYEGTFADDIVPAEWKKRGTKPIRPTTGYNAVENAADHILSTPRISVSPRPTNEDRQTEQMIAENKRAFLRFFWQTLESEQGDPLSSGKKHIIKDGKVAVKFEIDWDLVPDDVSERGTLGIEDFIWKTETLVPEMVYEDFDRPHDPRYVYERYNMYVSTAMAIFPESEESSSSSGGWRNKKPHTVVEVVEYWSKPGGSASDKLSAGEHVIWVDDDVVIDAENPYHWVRNPDAAEADQVMTGWVPYIIRPSGWGERKAKLEPEKVYVGIIRRDRSMLDAAALHYTAASVQLMLSTFPMILGFNVPDAVDLAMGPGKLIDLPGKPDEMNLAAFKMPDIPPGVWRIIDRMEGQSDNLTKFGALGGSPTPGADTATEIDANIRNASVKLASPVNAMRSVVAEVSKRAFQTIEHVVESPVTVFGVAEQGEGAVTISPEDLNGFYRVSVQLQTSDEAALEARNVRLWTDAKAKFRGLPETIAMEKAGIENPSAAIDMAAEEEIFWSPELQQVAKLLALVKLGEVAEPVRDAFARQIMAATEPPEGEGPPGTGDEMSTEAREATAPEAAIRRGQANALVDAPERAMQ